MTGALIWFFNNWLYAVGVILSFIAAFGFLIFLRGFLLGLNQVLYIDANAEHLDHARTRATWGFLIMLNIFVFWVFVRGIAALMGQTSVNAPLTFWILGIYALLVAIIFILNNLKK